MMCDHGHLEEHVTEDGGWCRGPLVNIAFRVVDPERKGHIEVDVFVGRKHSSRGRAGRIMLRRDEWDELEERIKGKDPIELGLTT